MKGRDRVGVLGEGQSASSTPAMSSAYLPALRNFLQCELIFQHFVGGLVKLGLNHNPSPLKYARKRGYDLPVHR